MGRFKSRAIFLRIIAANLSGILLTGKLFSRICNSAALSWGFAIPISTVLSVDLSNRITNSYIHGRRIANSPEQSRTNKTLLHETLSVPAVLYGLYQIEMGFGEIACRLFAFVIEGTQMDF